jgi:hypothetical protein
MTPYALIPATWELPEAIRERLGDGFGRQRAMFADGHLLLVLHAPPGPEDNAREGRLLWRAPTGAWRSSDLGDGSAALARHLAEYRTAIEQRDEQASQARVATEYFELLRALAPLQRAIVNGYQTLEDARKAVPEDRLLLNCRDQAYELQREADLLHATAKNALDFTIALRAEEESRSSRRMADAAHRLNMLVALFFPLATLSSVFGVNLSNGLEDFEGPIPIIALVVVGLACGALLARLIMRPRGGPDRP